MHVVDKSRCDGSGLRLQIGIGSRMQIEVGLGLRLQIGVGLRLRLQIEVGLGTGRCIDMVCTLHFNLCRWVRYIIIKHYGSTFLINPRVTNNAPCAAPWRSQHASVSDPWQNGRPPG